MYNISAPNLDLELLKAGKNRFNFWPATCYGGANRTAPTRAMAQIVFDNINKSKNLYQRFYEQKNKDISIPIGDVPNVGGYSNIDAPDFILKRSALSRLSPLYREFEDLEKFVKPYINKLSANKRMTGKFCEGYAQRLGDLNMHLSLFHKTDRKKLKRTLEPIMSFPTQKTVLDKLNQKHNKKDNTTTELTSRISALEQQIQTLTSSKVMTDSKGQKGGTGGVISDEITGLKVKISNLEKAVKLDPKLPSTNKDAGINYYINRNYEDIKSNYSQIDSIYDSLFRIQGSIDPTTDWSQDNNIDLMATIKSLTERVDALEA